MLTAAERAWGNPIVRSMIYSYISPQEGYAPLLLLDKASLEDALRLRFRHFRYTSLSSFRTKCEDTNRYKTCLSYVQELDRALLTRADVLDTLDVFPNIRIIRDTSRQNGPHSIFLPDRQLRETHPGAVIETTTCWKIQWLVPGAERDDDDDDDGIEDHEDISLTSAGIPRDILPSIWDVAMRFSVRLEYKQPSDDFFHPRTCMGLDRFCETGLGPFDGTTNIDALVLAFQPDIDIAKAAVRCLSERDPELNPRSLKMGCRLHTIVDVTDIIELAGNSKKQLERLCISFADIDVYQPMNFPGCLTLLDLLYSSAESWKYCKNLRHLSLVLRHDRVDQLPRRFEDPNDVQVAVHAIRRRDRKYPRQILAPKSSRLPQLESLEIILWWHIDPPVFHEAYVGEEELAEQQFAPVRDALWRLVRLNGSEVDALATFGPTDCRYTFKLWQGVDAPQSRGAMLMQDMEERLSRDVAERIPHRRIHETGLSRSEATTPDLSTSSTTSTVSDDDNAEPVIPVDSVQ